MKVLFFADYAEAHPRGFSLCKGMQESGIQCEYTTFIEHADRIEAEKSYYGFDNFTFIANPVSSKFQRLIPTRLYKSFWPFFSITFLEIIKSIEIHINIRKRDFSDVDCVVLSYSPLSIILGVIYCSKLRSIPKIVDWRDPYLYNHNTKFPKLRLFIRKFILKLIDRKVDHHITVSSGFKERLKAICIRPITIISNGSNQSLFEHGETNYGFRNFECAEDFSINYFGSVYKDRQPLISCLRNLEEYCVKSNCRVTLNFYGTNEKVITQIISGQDFKFLKIILHKKLPYDEFIMASRLGDINLVLGWDPRSDDIYNGAGILPTKFWECLGIGIPLLIYSHNEFDEMKRVAQEKFGLPVVSDSQSMQKFFEELHTRCWYHNSPEFSFEFRAQELAHLLRTSICSVK